MSFQVSPGVQVNEIDLTNVVPAVSTSIGGFAGHFEWGPIEEVVTVSSEKELASRFGTPSASYARSFFTAASFLKYGNALKVVRANATTNGSGEDPHQNATSGAGGNYGLLIKNRDHYEENYDDGSASVGAWAAKYAGTLGNSLKVSVCPASSTAFAAWTYASSFTKVPGTSDTATAGGSSNDELHIAVIDEDGLISGIAGTILEKFEFVSQAADAVKEDGTSNYYKNVVNTTSEWVWWLDHEATLSDAGDNAADGVTFTVNTSAFNYSLQEGTNYVADAGDVSDALAYLADAETVDVNLLFADCDANGATDVAAELITIAAARKDVVAFISPPIEDTVGTSSPATDVKAFADSLTSTSYAVIDSTALKIYDKYNDVYRWIPACGHVAGLCANTDDVADAWFSPAGFNRGQLLGVTKLAFNPKQADRDTLYKARINPIVSFPGQGTVLYGDKTLLAKPSAFDRINVRRLFITLEKAISTAAKYQLFELNDEFTRAMFRNMVEPFLRDVQGRRGVTDFLVVCDDTNNTGDVIDRNEFRADIYIKPARSINFITLNFIATRTGVEFSEIVGQ